MRDILTVIILSVLVWQLLRCEYKQPSKVHEHTFNGADTLKIMIHNDSITSIEPYKK